MGRKRVFSFAASIAVVLSVAVGSAAGQTGPSKDEMARYVAQLQTWFDASDLNHDGYLDTDELAKAFQAVAIVPQGVPPPAAGRVGPASAVLVSLPFPAPLANFPVAELLARPRPGARVKRGRLGVGAPGPIQPAKNLGVAGPLVGPPAGAAARVPPAQQFLQLTGKTGKKRISRSSFTSWTKKYLRSAYKELKAAQAVQKAEAKVAQSRQAVNVVKAKLQMAKTARAAQTAQKELEKKLQELERATVKLRERQQAFALLAGNRAGLSPAIRQVFALRP